MFAGSQRYGVRRSGKSQDEGHDCAVKIRTDEAFRVCVRISNELSLIGSGSLTKDGWAGTNSKCNENLV
jgi:hypothetical protein